MTETNIVQDDAIRFPSSLTIKRALKYADGNPLIAEMIVDQLCERVLVAGSGWWGCHYFAIKGPPPPYLAAFGAGEMPDKMGVLVEQAQQPGRQIEFGPLRVPPMNGGQVYRPVPLDPIIGAADRYLAACEFFHPEGEWGWVPTEAPLHGLFVLKLADGERVGIVPGIRGPAAS